MFSRKNKDLIRKKYRSALRTEILNIKINEH